MIDKDKSKKQLLNEIKELRRRNSELEASEEGRKQAEEALQSLIQKIWAAVIVYDADKKVIKSNATAQELLGLTEKKLLGKKIKDSVWNFLREDGKEMPYKEYPVSQVFASGQPLNNFIMGISRPKKKDIIWVLVGAVPVIDKDGVIFQVIVTFMDITIRKKTQEELQKAHKNFAKANEDLQFEISQRVQTEEQRRVLLNDLEQANKELKDFAYVVSHDLKAPLRGIRSIANWLAEDYAEALGKDGNKYIEDLLDQTKRMHSLIEGILQYSRIGRVKPELIRLSSETVAQEVINTLSPPDNISLKIEGFLPPVIYDKTHLLQLFQNLIGNAVKHLGKPEGEVTVSCIDKKNYWEFCVRDTGIGIDKKHFDRIFQIFQSLKPIDEVESTGIGLSLVKKIVERYGGSVRVESTIGLGTSFFFTIPKGLKPDVIETKLKILIIDDNVEYSEVATLLLKRDRREVLHASSGKKACELLNNHKEKINVALLDVNLPGEDVIEIYPVLKELHPEMKIVVCTGSGKTEQIEKLKSMGVEGVLYKPFRIDELNRIINSSINNKEKF
jgi:PAS domain S-box-containing protein